MTELEMEMQKHAVALRSLLDQLEATVKEIESAGFEVDVHQSKVEVTTWGDTAPQYVNTFSADLRPKAFPVRT